MKVEIRLIDDAGSTYEGTVQLTPVLAGNDTASIRIAPDSPSEPKGLPGQILALRDANFFREPQTAEDVHKKLSTNYHCLLNRVQMALLRLQRRRDLRKAVKRNGDQEQAAYVW
jgi:hypothetical protein